MTDLDVTIRTHIEADVETTGNCTVRAGMLYNLVNSFTGLEPVEMEAADNEVTIKCGQSKYTLGTLSHDEFPPQSKLAGSMGSRKQQFFASRVHGCLISAFRCPP